MEIAYIGEHLLPGILGKVLIWIGFWAAILSAGVYLYDFFCKRERFNLIRNARLLYIMHATALIAAGLILYFLIFRHYFEYSYVWQYSSKALPVRYIISCFWAGQEGSFLVWAVWQALAGIVILFISRDWEKPVMAVVSISQAFLTSMLLGVQFFGIKIGSSPFLLLRETMESVDGTIFALPNYLSMISDGNGLNPLLENIWMTIHPPVLFLGYALALVPFAYAAASLMKKDYYSWVSRAIPWSLASLLFLGAGILLGGAWAYVSLTFGGFWTWDPVENSSLVPWLTLLAGLHFLLIARRQNYALPASYMALMLSYVLVLYASFLTRSGVLGNTSAHSFGDNGMTLQLLLFLLTFFFFTVVIIGYNLRRIHKARKDMLWSREFWMFIGSVVITLAAFQIIFTTSIPVFNSLLGTSFAPPVDSVGFYNKWQTPFAILIAGFIAFSQVLNYQSNRPGTLWRRMWMPLSLSAILTTIIFFSGVLRQLNMAILVFFAITAFFALMNKLFFSKAKPVNYGAIITHAGFVIFLTGTVLTFLNAETISSNTSRYDLGDDQRNAENLVLMRNDTLYMNRFYVSYVFKRIAGNTTVYQVDFLKFKNGQFQKTFSLYPSVNVHPRMGAVYNPDTRHFLTRDYYSYISAVSREPDYIVIKTIMNPNINILWIGCLAMIIGLAVSLYRRARRLWLVTGR